MVKFSIHSNSTDSPSPTPPPPATVRVKIAIIFSKIAEIFTITNNTEPFQIPWQIKNTKSNHQVYQIDEKFTNEIRFVRENEFVKNVKKKLISTKTVRRD